MSAFKMPTHGLKFVDKTQQSTLTVGPSGLQKMLTKDWEQWKKQKIGIDVFESINNEFDKVINPLGFDESIKMERLFRYKEYRGKRT